MIDCLPLFDLLLFIFTTGMEWSYADGVFVLNNGTGKLFIWSWNAVEGCYYFSNGYDI